MLLFTQIQLHDHSSVFGVAEVLFAIVRQGGVQFRLRHIGLVQQNVQLLLCCLTSLLPVRRQDHVCMDMQSHETYKIGKATKIILASALFWT